VSVLAAEKVALGCGSVGSVRPADADRRREEGPQGE